MAADLGEPLRGGDANGPWPGPSYSSPYQIGVQRVVKMREGVFNSMVDRHESCIVVTHYHSHRRLKRTRQLPGNYVSYDVPALCNRQSRVAHPLKASPAPPSPGHIDTQ